LRAIEPADFLVVEDRRLYQIWTTPKVGNQAVKLQLKTLGRCVGATTG
jgi:hypothetical protein